MVEQRGEYPRGIRNISTFVTADALLAAVLLVWGQLWIQPSVQLWATLYGRQDQIEGGIKTLQTFDLNVGVGLIWTYFAVLLALLALILVGYRTLRTPGDRVSNTALGLFGASLIMALINVFQSICTISIKLLSSRSIWEPLSISAGFYAVGLEVVAIIGIVALSMWFTHKSNE